MRVAVSGATGLIGSALARSLTDDGHDVQRLTRSPSRPSDIRFDPARRILDAAALDGTDAVVHLAGEPIAQRWSDDVRRRIRDSRVDGTHQLASALATLERPPRVLVSGSAVGIYGDRGDERLTERSAPGGGFLAEVCIAWEAAAAPARDAGIRVAHPRIGVVLSPDGGALARLLRPFRLGLGGRIGDGRQWMSWISLPDVVAMLRRLVDDDALSGPYNATGPSPVTNGEFTRELGEVLHRPAILPVPSFALRAVFREMADATLMASQHAAPERMQAAGFAFAHPTLRRALDAVLHPGAT
jgi:uncharacterized protein